MDFKSRYLLYETVKQDNYMDYAEVVHIINDKLINVNIGGQKDIEGNLILLEAVLVEGNYIPKIGDWVGIEWRDGQPIAIGNQISTGLTNINDNVKIVSVSDLADNVINTDHIRTNAIEAKHIRSDQITANHIEADAINSDHIAAESIESAHIQSAAIESDHISAGAIEASHISSEQITVDKLESGAKEVGLYGTYFDGELFETYLGAQVDTTIQFDWANEEKPHFISEKNRYSIRWTGFIYAPRTGDYEFYIQKSHGVRLWVHGQKVMDAWNGRDEEVFGKIHLEEKSWITIRLDYYDDSGNGGISLKWKPPAGSKEIVPTDHFKPKITTIDGATIETGTIKAEQIATGTITAESGIIADLTIQSGHIADASITSAKIGSGEIDSVHIAEGSISTVHIEDASITSAQIAALDAGLITTGVLNSDVISTISIESDNITSDAVQSRHIAANQIDADHIKSGAITATEIAAQSVTSDKIQAGAITGDSIKVGTIQTQHISTQGLDAQSVMVYDSDTGETLIGGGYLRVDGLDVGVVQSDNLIANGLFLTASSQYGLARENPYGEVTLGTKSAIENGNQIWKLDIATGKKVEAIHIHEKRPVDISINDLGTTGYVTVQGDDSLVELDLVNDITTDLKLKMGKGPSTIKWTGDKLGDHKHFLILNRDPKDLHVPDSLIVVDATHNPMSGGDGSVYVHHKIPLGNNPYDFVLDDSKKLYVTMANQGDIVVLDLSGHDSSQWWVIDRIPISAYGTDNYHGGLSGEYGLKQVTGGDSASQYDETAGTVEGVESTDGAHQHGGYGSTDGSLRQYEPRGIALSSDTDHLYVVDHKNNELVVVDKTGKAPYNGLTGRDSSSETPAVSREEGVSEGGGPDTPYVRYRIPIGDAPEHVEVMNGKVFVTLLGSGEIAMIDEQDILDEIAADREYYNESWHVFIPMREEPTFQVRKIFVGSKPSHIQSYEQMGKLFVSLSGQDEVISIDVSSEQVVDRIQVGSNPQGLAVTPDGKFLYVVNQGGSGDLSFIYPSGNYIGDPYLGLEGGVEYQGAEFWTPDRSDWVYDQDGNIQSMSTVEFRINEPFLNEGGYAKLSAIGKDKQSASIEQDVYNVTNYSNGNNVMEVIGEKLSTSDGTVFYPQNQWLENPAPNNAVIATLLEGEKITTPISSSDYTINYDDNAHIEYSGRALTEEEWIEMDYTCRNDIYFKPHNGSLLVAVENGSSPNFNVQFEIDEFVPKFVVIDNQQTDAFVPLEDGITEEYMGLEYSTLTDRAEGKHVTSSQTPTQGELQFIVDGIELDMAMHGNHSIIESISSTEVTLPNGLQHIEIDLGQKYMIGRLNVCHKFNSERTYKGTKTEVSEDGIHWTTVYDSEVDGEYVEKKLNAHGHIELGKEIAFHARPIRYVRDYANGWYDESGNHGEENTWASVKVYGDWEVHEDYVWDEGTEKAGQQIATNGKCFVSTDISNAFIAFDIAIEYTTWWYMTYITGPEFGKMAIEMPTLMNSNHYLHLESPYVNNIAHRHIMSFPPSSTVKGDINKNIKDGKHRVILRQESGRVSLDRVRIEDYQYHTRSSLLIPSSASSATFQRKKLIAEQTKWFEGVGRQTTYGPYDEPRRNVDTGELDYSVPIKYRFRFKVELVANGDKEERGIAYITSCIMETGKLHTHWRRSEASDSFPASKLEKWDGNQPHKTGIQAHHIANGAIKGTKILPGSIMDYHVSNYAAIQEHKLDLNHPTHNHGRTEVIPGAGPFGSDLHVWIDNKEVIDSIEGIGLADAEGQEVPHSGNSGNVARADHTHPQYLELSSGGNITADLTVEANIHLGEGNTVDGVNLSELGEDFTQHKGSRGSAHATATESNAGFISGADQKKLNDISEQATKVEKASSNGDINIDGVRTNVYTHPSNDGDLHVPATGTTNNGKFLKAGNSAKSAAWQYVQWSDIQNIPNSNVSQIDQGVSKSHDQNTDSGTTTDIFKVGSSKEVGLGMGIGFSNEPNHPYWRWSGQQFQAYTSWNSDAAERNWSEIKAATFRNSQNIEVSYEGHLHTWSELQGKPSTYTPPIATAIKLGGVKVGENITLTSDGEISVNYPISTITQAGLVKVGDYLSVNQEGLLSVDYPAVTSGTDGIMTSEDKVKLDTITDRATRVETARDNGKLSIDGVVSTIYAHPTNDGDLHVPATGTVSEGKFLKADGSAKSFGWEILQWSDIHNKPTSSVSNIDTAVSQTHVQNTDLGTTNNVFSLNFGETVSSGGHGVSVGSNSSGSPDSHPYLRWNADHTRWEMYKAWGSTPDWGEVRAETFRKSDGTEVSYHGHQHAWSEITDKPAEFTPPIATTSRLGGLKVGNHLSVSADGTIQGNYPLASTVVDGLMSSSDKDKLDQIENNAMNQQSADARYLQLSGGEVTGLLTLGDKLYMDNASGSSSPLAQYTNVNGNTYLYFGTITQKSMLASIETPVARIGNDAEVYKIWTEKELSKAEFATANHTHTVADIIDIDTIGDIKSDTVNTFNETNTFSKNGLALEIRPSITPVQDTKLFRVAASDGSDLVTINSEGKLQIAGDLVVDGDTVYQQEQVVEGNMDVDGNLTVKGNSILGNAPTDETTIKGNMRLEGEFKPVGKALEVGRFPLYGVGGDLQFQTDSTTWEDILVHYNTFRDNRPFPPVANGAERRYRVMISYSTVGDNSEASLRVVRNDDASQVIAEWTLDTVWGSSNGTVATMMLDEFSTSYASHTNWQASSSGSGKDMIIKYIEVIAYDYYA
ncbi:PA14 domain-containing protein [Chengkuizengella axinellae]|uniref:PA14 domain-containing protein n=1 Tax=Chengkuizengella axinellae TaxID=3064388 RepID=A0ABT9IWE7_9BACL|nr:PA14 domain-containing protein [Chengkuizengella sp. 2205SS18-9]MDP5273676.1 PA14 domain-containing protein [Chengkuizengella sp. 2205SS18-9]